MSYHYKIACVTCEVVDEPPAGDHRQSIRCSAGGIGFQDPERTDQFLMEHQHHCLTLVAEGERDLADHLAHLAAST